MKEPASKLPWSLIHDNTVGFYSEGECFLIGDEYYKEQDAEYIVEACNNYPEAVSLLKEYMKEPDAGNHDLNPKIEEFLKKIEGKE